MPKPRWQPCLNIMANGTDLFNPSQTTLRTSLSPEEPELSGPVTCSPQHQLETNHILISLTPTSPSQSPTLTAIAPLSFSTLSALTSLTESPPPVSQKHFDSSSSSEDKNHSNRQTRKMAPTQSKVTCMEQSAPTKIPVLTPGDLTPESLCAFEMGCKAYFSYREIPDEEQVEKITWGIQDPWIQNWYLMNHERINAMSFRRYMLELR